MEAGGVRMCGMTALDSRRLRDPLLVLLIVAGLFFGLVPLLVPPS